MWTKEARERHVPRKDRYPSDLTDAEWQLIEPMIPKPRRGGRPRSTDMREVMNAVRYVLRTGCQWRQLPKDFPPRSTVYSYFWDWARYGVLDQIHHVLLMECREAGGREASPTAAIIDTQAVRATEKGGAAGIRLATMRAKKSRESNATRSLTPSASSLASRRSQQMSRTGIAPRR
jgi:transposase